MLAVAALSPRQAFAQAAPRGGGGSRLPGTLYALSVLDADTGERLWTDELAHFGVIYGTVHERSA